MRERAAETVGWMVRDMTAERVDGRAAFAASEDADSEGEEGRFYVWTEAEVDALLGEASAAFKRAYDVTPGGNWEGHTILRRVTPRGSAEDESGAGAVARRCCSRHARSGCGRDATTRCWRTGTGWRSRPWRVPPWCSGGPTGSRAPRRRRISSWRRCRRPDGRVQHAWRLGRVTAAGLLEDQAAMARASLALFEATGEARRLAEAIRLADAAEAAFADGHGRLLHHGRGCDRRAADAAAHGGGQRHAGRAIGDAGGGVRAALAPDRRRGVAGAGRGAAARVHRQAGSVRGDADAAGGGGSAGGSGDRGDRRRSAHPRAGACGGGARRGGSGGRGAAAPTARMRCRPTIRRSASRPGARARRPMSAAAMCASSPSPRVLRCGPACNGATPQPDRLSGLLR